MKEKVTVESIKQRLDRLSQILDKEEEMIKQISQRCDNISAKVCSNNWIKDGQKVCPRKSDKIIRIEDVYALKKKLNKI